MRGDEHHRAGLDQGEGFAEGEFFHERLRHRLIVILRVTLRVLNQVDVLGSDLGSWA